MKLVTGETQCCIVGVCGEDVRSSVYHMGTEYASSYDAVVPGMMGAPSSGGMNRKMLCQVCGALSSGLHFGVFTCEGCKCFYRRSIKEGANYACAKERNCEITMETRNSCRYCRFQKCLALGMSKEGIKLGRRPKVDSDVFQHGFYPPGDMDYHTHAYWTHASMEHPNGFKAEPIYSELGDEMTRERLIYTGRLGMNYAMKPEPYCHGQQVNGHYGQEGYGDGQNGHHHSPDGRLAIYQHHTPGCMPSEMYAEQSQSHHPQGAQLQQWSSELSPTASASGSEDNWDAGSPGGLHSNRAAASVSLTLPEVQSGAAAAMAYANLYRGRNDGDEKAMMNNHSEGAAHNGQLESTKTNLVSYTELVPRKADSPNTQCSRNQSASMYHHDLKSKHLHSPTRGGAGSVSPHQIKTNKGRDSPWTSGESTASPAKRKFSDKIGDNVAGKSPKMSDSNLRLCKSEQLRLVHELMDYFLPLEKVVLYQWQAYLQSYGEQTFSDQPRYKDAAHLTAFLKTHGEEVFYQIRKFAANLPGFEELSPAQKDSLLHCTAPSIITTCLLQSECGTGDGGKHEKGSVTSIDEGACFCAVLLLMAGKKQQSLTNELCSKLSLILEDYINETLTRRDPEKLQWLLHQLYSKHWQD
ncbi:LOW QUALITY PROTEIN: uncharacterized protein [Amphiura filiformis]|uniref:LOW QUALITY PROTEIN: uncharacterized protein n=1 Tax=Amphiura filiformis TaxID=82378 RepID=UPI003B221C5B